MKFDVGDKVEVIDDAIKGTVLFVQGNKVTIETEEGFEMNVDTDELIKIAPDTYTVSNIEAYRAISEKELPKKRKPKTVKREKQQPPMEVDLHIHQLISSTKGLTNHDMLTLQVETAKRQLNYAIGKRIQRVVFIHGVGEGVLRTELEYVFGRYDNITFYDADYQKYGLGATEVYIRQNA
ncbi:DNA mismatch repair protein MutS [Zhouia spongiae]|uniref:DNA mismatch repair protein MutS n=1 Tax=Zhouia spongiae TaxID=2202721 RepID=A0ABY3YIL2_9FLAO|nr:Smr/MutS family protein [Zhouia spongiae]UNY97520.1 DNA mismatch repair protein MutS [Zhouia spongiae]